ncbi:hypothetical protein RBWH47_05052 [Rhodopirellula baltica WH47]|uniref:Uncharacterized protein n=1 Tax=Rhodopirellula baltica WH47 TaxID=991778 RepID=F2B0Y2_RHOBT|nr:hypothetical protein RBWH47_05052 [Rhodopirellula baltica WH47]
MHFFELSTSVRRSAMISKPAGLGRWHHCPQRIARTKPTVGDAGRDKSLSSVFFLSDCDVCEIYHQRNATRRWKACGLNFGSIQKYVMQ